MELALPEHVERGRQPQSRLVFGVSLHIKSTPPHPATEDYINLSLLPANLSYRPPLSITWGHGVDINCPVLLDVKDPDAFVMAGGESILWRKFENRCNDFL